MSFYTAAVGAQQQQLRMNVQANNIANVNTYGFKAAKPSFATLMYGSVNGIDGNQLPRGTGSYMIMTNTDSAPSGLASTDRPQDYAIIGDGFFAVEDPITGQISYTRDGSFSASGVEDGVDENGVPTAVWYLSDGHGNFVLSTEGTRIEVKNTADAQPVGIFDFVNTDGMIHIGSNRFIPTEKNGNVRLSNSTLIQGALESSNADLSYEIAKVIEAQRSFSYALKMVQTSDEIETTVINLR